MTAKITPRQRKAPATEPAAAPIASQAEYEALARKVMTDFWQSQGTPENVTATVKNELEHMRRKILMALVGLGQSAYLTGQLFCAII